jgi:hypothetical protein
MPAPTIDPAATVHTLRSRDGWECVHFVATTDPDCVLVQWVTVDDGDAETGPSSRSCEEPMCKADARDVYRDTLRQGWTASSHTPTPPPPAPEPVLYDVECDVRLDGDLNHSAEVRVQVWATDQDAARALVRSMLAIAPDGIVQAVLARD